jgi:hypothetical protein
MNHRTAKLSVKFFVSALLAVLLLAAPVSTQTTSPTFPGMPASWRWEPYTTSGQAPAADARPGADRRRPTARDLIFSDDQLSEQQAQGRGDDRRSVTSTRRLDPDRDRLLTIPHWSDSYTYQGLTYKYTMVGTHPKHGSATTVIPTVIIPIRFVFEDGTVLDPSTDLTDGQTAIERVVNSPIFQPHDFRVGGVSVGNTQHGDAFQRANFWGDVSRQSPDYHVLLGQPTIAPTVEVFVDTYPFIKGGQLWGWVPPDILHEVVLSAIRQSNVSPQTLPIIYWGRLLNVGYNGTYEVPGGLQTYIATGRRIEYLYPERETDEWLLSAQIIRWLNNPFDENFTPGWNLPWGADLLCFSSYEAITDKLYSGGGTVSVRTASGAYSLAGGEFLDYFTRAAPSRSVNGQYTFDPLTDYGLPNSPSSPCTGHVEVERTIVVFPRSIETIAYGINNKGWVVGSFVDGTRFRRRHGFIFDGTNYQQIDYPGATSTTVYAINDSGQAVGHYFKAGLPHGFLYFEGNFTPIDFPGATDTMPRSINSRGDIVGLYDATQEITHGFIYQNGQYRTLDTPFAQQTEVTAINDHGEVVGYAWDDPFNGPVLGFSLDGDGFKRFDVPGAQDTTPRTINNLGMQGGVFFDLFGVRTGYVTIYGYPYQVYGSVNGMNDKGQIVGSDTIINHGPVTQHSQRFGYVATLPR